MSLVSLVSLLRLSAARSGLLALPAEPVDVLLGDALAGRLRLLDGSELEDPAWIDHAAPGGRSRPEPGDPAQTVRVHGLTRRDRRHVLNAAEFLNRHDSPISPAAPGTA